MKVILSAVFGISALVLFLSMPVTEEIVYDCSLAEFHPDFPPKVREECRKLRLEHWKREQDEKKNGTRIHENRRNLFTT